MSPTFERKNQEEKAVLLIVMLVVAMLAFFAGSIYGYRLASFSVVKTQVAAW